MDICKKKQMCNVLYNLNKEMIDLELLKPALLTVVVILVVLAIFIK